MNSDAEKESMIAWLPALLVTGKKFESGLALVCDRDGTIANVVRAAIEGTRNFVGITGVFDFSATDHNGLDRRAATMIQISDGQWRPAK